MKHARRGGWVVLGVLAGTLVGAAAFAYSGLYNVAADVPHTRPMHALLETMRERSIARRASSIAVPGDLASDARVRQGAGNYNAMCMGCHLAPGMGETELSRGLSPRPPDLTRETVDAATAFWVIKHGIKASGMPAWGESMGDEYVWNMAAFLQRLPTLDADAYQALVASSGGHSHGGNETRPHGHDEDTTDDQHPAPSADASHAHPPETPAHEDAPADPPAPIDTRARTPGSSGMSTPTPPEQAQAAPASATHRHADGTVETHPVTPPPHDEGHDDQH